MDNRQNPNRTALSLPGTAALQSLQKSNETSNLAHVQRVTEAYTAATRMYACYRREDAAQAETMLDAVAAVLAEYPEEVIRLVTDPRTGLPGRMKFPPAVAEVREACELAMGPVNARAAREKREAEAAAQVAERERLEEFCRTVPKVDLKERHGPNYGLGSPGIVKEDEARAKHLARVADANERLFRHECKAAGIDPDKTDVSPALAAIIKGRQQAAE
jgi:hypothetical protein